MHTRECELTDNDKCLRAAARAATRRTAALHAELCGGAGSAQAAQQLAVNTDPPFAPVVPYWQEPTPAAQPLAVRNVARTDPPFAPVVPYWDAAEYQRRLAQERGPR